MRVALKSYANKAANDLSLKKMKSAKLLLRIDVIPSRPFFRLWLINDINIYNVNIFDFDQLHFFRLQWSVYCSFISIQC